MGPVLILLGLALVGLVVDFSIENHLGAAPSQPFDLLGTSLRLSREQLVLVAFIGGAAVVLLIAAGIRLARHRQQRRRALKRRVGDLEREKDELRSPAPRDATVDEPAGEGDPSMQAGAPQG